VYYKTLENRDLFITQRNRPWWHTAIAGLSYTVAISALYFFFTNFNGISLPGLAFVLTYSIMMGLRFSMMIHYHFDFVAFQYKKEKSVGPIRFGKWKPFENLGYIGVFNNASGLYDLNLWYDGNQYFTIKSFQDMKEALEMGEELAKKMDIDLLDAAGGPHDSKWVDLD
jgi:hypothetical protein